MLRPDLPRDVVDRWWPHRVGTIVARLKTRLRVRWSDGAVWTYDREHVQFLQPRTTSPTPPATDRKRKRRTDGVNLIARGARFGRAASLIGIARMHMQDARNILHVDTIDDELSKRIIDAVSTLCGIEIDIEAAIVEEGRRYARR